MSREISEFFSLCGSYQAKIAQVIMSFFICNFVFYMWVTESCDILLLCCTAVLVLQNLAESFSLPWKLILLNIVFNHWPGATGGTGFWLYYILSLQWGKIQGIKEIFESRNVWIKKRLSKICKLSQSIVLLDNIVSFKKNCSLFLLKMKHIYCMDVFTALKYQLNVSL